RARTLSVHVADEAGRSRAQPLVQRTVARLAELTGNGVDDEAAARIPRRAGPPALHAYGRGPACALEVRFGRPLHGFADRATDRRVLIAAGRLRADQQPVLGVGLGRNDVEADALRLVDAAERDQLRLIE